MFYSLDNELYDKIYLIQDCDVDGVTSCVVTYLYLRHIGVNNIQVLFHSDKQHGLTKEIMEQIGDDTNIVWLPDAGTNDVK